MTLNQANVWLLPFFNIHLEGFYTSPPAAGFFCINKLFANDGDPMLFIDILGFASNFVATFRHEIPVPSPITS